MVEEFNKMQLVEPYSAGFCFRVRWRLASESSTGETGGNVSRGGGCGARMM